VIDPSKEPKAELCQRKEASPSHNVTKELLDYLQSVAESPFARVSERDKMLGGSPWKGNRIRTELSGKGFVKTIAVNPGGRGRRFQLLELTDTGRDLLKSFGVEVPCGRGRGGLEHQWWCHTISNWLTDMGLTAVIEDDSQGARVDVAVTTGDRTVAVEIEVSPGHEALNIAKDVAAGFNQVVSLVKEPAAVATVKAGIGKDLGDLANRSVHVGCLRDYAKVLESAMQVTSVGQG
jgi:hypothetical protein